MHIIMSQNESPELTPNTTRRHFTKKFLVYFWVASILTNTSCNVEKTLNTSGWKKWPQKRAFRTIQPNWQDEPVETNIASNDTIEETFENRHLWPHRIDEKYKDERWKPNNSLRWPLTTKVNVYLTIDDSTPMTSPWTENLAIAYVRNLELNEIKGAFFFINGYNRKVDRRKNESVEDYKLRNIFYCPWFTPTPGQNMFWDNDLLAVKETEYYKELVAFVRHISSHWHYVHNHTWNHTVLGRTIMKEIEKKAYLFGMKVLQHAINEGVEWSGQELNLFRYAGGSPPRLDVDFQNSIHKTMVECNIHGALDWPKDNDTKDYLKPGPEVIQKAFINAQKEGEIVLTHDKYGPEVFPSIGLTWIGKERKK